MRKIKIGVFVFFGLLLGYTTSSLAFDTCFESVRSDGLETYHYKFYSEEVGEGNFALVGHAYKDAGAAGQEPTHGNFITVDANETRMTLVRSGSENGTIMATATLYVTMNTAPPASYKYLEKLDTSTSEVPVYTEGTFSSEECL